MSACRCPSREKAAESATARKPVPSDMRQGEGDALSIPDLAGGAAHARRRRHGRGMRTRPGRAPAGARRREPPGIDDRRRRSEEHTSELQSLMRISYAVFCLKKKKNT